jgi:hypothetical protein
MGFTRVRTALSEVRYDHSSGLFEIALLAGNERDGAEYFATNNHSELYRRRNS